MSIFNPGFLTLTHKIFMSDSRLTLDQVNACIKNTIADAPTPSTFNIGLFLKDPSPGPVWFKQTENGTFAGELLGEEIVFTDLFSTWSTLNAMFFVEDSRDHARAATNLSHVILYNKDDLVRVMYIRED